MTLDRIAQRLQEAGIEDSRREARSLIIAVTNIDPYLSDDWLAQIDRVDVALARRERREPLSKIMGKREFYGRDFIVTEDVLDPRPDSETLIEEALSIPYKRVLDLGTGSGCLILTLLAENKEATGVAVDISAKALDVAKQNAMQLGVAERVKFYEAGFETFTWPHPERVSGSMGNSRMGPETSSGCDKFDLLISNPPYIKSADIAGLEPEVTRYDPMLALDGGADGCDPYRVIFARMNEFLTPNGYFLLEIAPDICENLLRLAQESGCRDVKITRDLAGRERVLSGRCG